MICHNDEELIKDFNRELGSGKIADRVLIGIFFVCLVWILKSRTFTSV